MTPKGLARPQAPGWCDDAQMDAQTIDQEFEKLKTEFHDVAMTVTSLSEKMQVAKTAGDANAAAWLDDLKLIAKDIDDEQSQAHTLLLAIHGFITSQAQAPAQPDPKPPLFAPGQEPDADEQQAQQQQQQPQRHGLFGGGGIMGGGMMGGMMGGGMMGGGMMGGYGGSGFARSMDMGMGMSLGANLLGSLFR